MQVARGTLIIASDLPLPSTGLPICLAWIVFPSRPRTILSADEDTREDIRSMSGPRDQSLFVQLHQFARERSSMHLLVRAKEIEFFARVEWMHPNRIELSRTDVGYFSPVDQNSLKTRNFVHQSWVLRDRAANDECTVDKLDRLLRIFPCIQVYPSWSNKCLQL